METKTILFSVSLLGCRKQYSQPLNTEEGFLRFETVNLKLKQRFVVSSRMNCLEVICNKRD